MWKTTILKPTCISFPHENLMPYKIDVASETCKLSLNSGKRKIELKSFHQQYTDQSHYFYNNKFMDSDCKVFAK